MTVLDFAVAIVVGYFAGSINPAALIARARGVDLRASGSGNPGATNAARVMGRKTGVVVLLIDILKGLIPVVLFTALISPNAGALAGFAAIIGHMTSPFLKGRGGKGVATTLGAVGGMYTWWLVPMLVVFAIVFVISKRTGIASIAGSAGLVVTALLTRPTPLLTVTGVLIGLLVISRHRANMAAAWAAWRAVPDDPESEESAAG